MNANYEKVNVSYDDVRILCMALGWLNVSSLDSNDAVRASRLFRMFRLMRDRFEARGER